MKGQTPQLFISRSFHSVDQMFVKSYRRSHQHLASQFPFTHNVILRYFSVKVGFLFFYDLYAGERLQDLGLALWKTAPFIRHETSWDTVLTIFLTRVGSLTSKCEFRRVSSILHLNGVIRNIVRLAVVDGQRHILSIFVDFHLVRRSELIFSFEPLPVGSVLEQLTFEGGLGLRFHMLVSQRLHQPVFDDFWGHRV